MRDINQTASGAGLIGRNTKVSYSIKVVVKDGVASVAPEGTTTGAAAPPDGSYSINGHFPSPESWKAENISVMRLDTDSNTVIHATATYHMPPVKVVTPVVVEPETGSFGANSGDNLSVDETATA